MSQLCPAQQLAFDRLLQQMHTHSVLEILGNPGMGKTTLLHHAHQYLGGELLQMYDFIDQTKSRHPFALEEAFEAWVMTALQQHEIVIIDDISLLLPVCYGHYPRYGLVSLPLRKICTAAASRHKTLIFAGHDDCAQVKNFYPLAESILIENFAAMDYGFLCYRYLDAAIASHLDYDKIYRFASNLNAYQLRHACLELQDSCVVTTDGFIDYLKSRQLSSNVDLGEVQPADFSLLKGIDDVLASLEANLIIPLENDELAKQLDLKPKRGVLLAGPPGTGKTTIGRALAHRLKSKFFLIDGTFISGSGDFYTKIHYVFEAAKHNAPAIVFIDDTDVIFESGDEMGLYRYLLTLLDGLESETAGRVCVMMTAMNIGNLPPALVRSGRIELWLELRLPNEAARTEILTTAFGKLSLALSDADVAQLVTATEGFTGADLKRLIEEGKTLYAFDLVRGNSFKSATSYFLAAVEIVMGNKQRYAEALAHHQSLSYALEHRYPSARLLDRLQGSLNHAVNSFDVT
ncbi:MAG: AAA family ATPase [Leptolyngbyaceae cyanobacterium bins.349]|nr:AAA family ATPase [Leptolyngbyaceae cyanobacterium bins.349]